MARHTSGEDPSAPHVSPGDVPPGGHVPIETILARHRRSGVLHFAESIALTMERTRSVGAGGTGVNRLATLRKISRGHHSADPVRAGARIRMTRAPLGSSRRPPRSVSSTPALRFRTRPRSRPGLRDLPAQVEVGRREIFQPPVIISTVEMFLTIPEMASKRRNPQVVKTAPSRERPRRGLMSLQPGGKFTFQCRKSTTPSRKSVQLAAR